MEISKPFTFILHIISKNQHITDMTIVGIAYRSIEPRNKIAHLTYSINQIILDRDDITDLASHVDIQQINNACLNFAQAVFEEEKSVPENLHNFPGSPALFIPAIAN